MVVFNANKLASQEALKLRSIWKELQPQSCPYSYNFHTHTIFSDGRLNPLESISQAASLGLKGMAITDHHAIAGYLQAKSWLADKPNTLPYLFSGIEISAELLGIEVHILGYGFSPQHPALGPYIRGKSPTGVNYLAANAIAAIHQAGGLAVLAHPQRYQKPADVLIPAIVELEIDGVEAYYAYGNPKPWQPSPIQTKKVLQLSQKYNLYVTCGTDTHGLNLLYRI